MSKYVAILLLTLQGVVMAENKTGQSTPVIFKSEGFEIAGRFFEAGGEGPFPTVVLLQGMPGSDGDLFGLGEHLSENGMNAFTFNYRGTWKSQGKCLPSTSLEDVQAALDYVRTSEVATRFSIDTSHLSLVGYSYGGGMALLGAARDSSIRNIVSIAGGDLNVIARLLETMPEFRLAHRQLIDAGLKQPGVFRGVESGEAYHQWILENRDQFDLLQHAGALSQRRVLLLGGWDDSSIPVEEHILPLYRAIQQHSPEHLRIKAYECDHSLEGFRDQLVEDVSGWLAGD